MAKKPSAKSRAMRRRWKNPVYRARMARLSKRLWGDPRLRRQRIRSMRGHTHSPQHRRRISEALKRAWQRPSYRRKMAAMMSERSRSPLSRRRRGVASRRMWTNPTIRQRILAALRRAWDKPVNRRRMSQMQKRRWRDPEYRRRLLSAIRGNFGPSLGARTLFDILGEGFFLEYYSPHGPIDIANPDLRIAIEVDGADHDKAKQQARDRVKERGLRRDGWTVYRLCEYKCRALPTRKVA